MEGVEAEAAKEAEAAEEAVEKVATEEVEVRNVCRSLCNLARTHS